MEFSVRHFEVVLAVSQHGSISAAAAALGLSQPSLSSQLSRIEKGLGGALFHRTRRGVTPTPLGELVLQRAGSVLEEFHALVEDARREARGRRAMRVSANRMPEFPTLLPELMAAIPEREIIPHAATSTATIVDLLASDQLDLALVGVHPGVDRPCPAHFSESVVVASEPFLVAMSDRHRLAAQAEVDIADLGEDNWLLPPGRTDGTAVSLQRAFAQAGIRPPTPLGRQRLSDYTAYVAAGFGVALAVPTVQPDEGMVLRPLKGQPVVGRRVLRWHPERVTLHEAAACLAATRKCIAGRLEKVASGQPWWNDTPWHRPVLTPGDGVPQGSGRVPRPRGPGTVTRSGLVEEPVEHPGPELQGVRRDAFVDSVEQ